MRLFAEIVGWAAIVYGVWWVLILLLEVAAMLIATKWPFLRIGRLCIYFDSIGGLGTVTSVTFPRGGRYDQLFWLFYWKRNNAQL